MAPRPCGRAHRGRRPAGDCRIPPRRPSAGQHAALELARLRRRECARARSCGVRSRHARSGRSDRERRNRSADVDHPSLSARKARGCAERNTRPAGQLREGGGGPVRLGFLGSGWIGRNRMEPMLATGEAEAVAICDPDPENLAQALELAPRAERASSLQELLGCEPDGVVIATPSALHAEQCVTAFDRDVAVFCQKPLGRNAFEVRAVLDAAARADGLLGVDLSYRHTAAMQAIRERLRAGDLGKVFAADLTFHNAYGPQSGWFWDPKLSG